MRSLFALAPKLLIGVVHLRPLPGAPRFAGDFRAVTKAAVADAIAYERGGAHAIILENFGDLPFSKASVAPETVAAMTAVGVAVRSAIQLPLGFNVLRNDALAALALCTAVGGRFIRVNVHCGAMVTDQGLIEGNAYQTLRQRQHLCPDVEIFADVHVKHAVPFGDWSLEEAARDAVERRCVPA